MTTELESEVESMCNLSQGIYNQGLEKGIERGLEKGIIVTVEVLREDGASDADIVKRIMAKYNLTKEKAEEYVLTPCNV